MAKGPSKATRSERRWTAVAGTIPSILSSVIATALTIVTLIYLVLPRYKPPEKFGASITKALVQHSVKFGDSFAEITGEAPNDSILQAIGGSSDPSLKERLGTILYVQIDLQGYRNREYSVLPSMYKAKGKTRLTYPFYNYCPSFRTQASQDKVVALCWIGDPPSPGQYFIRLTLYDLVDGKQKFKGHPPVLDVLDTKPFKAPSK